VRLPFPSPTLPYPSRAEVLLGYLAYFRSVLVAKLDGLPEAELLRSRLPSGWTPLQLLKHLTYVERRWLVWGFEGRAVGDPWGDERDGHWYVAPDETLEALRAALRRQTERTSEIVHAHDLTDVGSPASGGTGPSRRLSSACCSILCRSTPGTSATSTSSAS